MWSGHSCPLPLTFFDEAPTSFDEGPPRSTNGANGKGTTSSRAAKHRGNEPALAAAGAGTETRRRTSREIQNRQHILIPISTNAQTCELTLSKAESPNVGRRAENRSLQEF